MTLCIGLTGGIGCGKSSVANLFAKLGACIIDTDEISHRLTATNGAGITPIRMTFGDIYITPEGALDRAKIRNLIFSEPPEKKRLEQILHPLILAEVNTRLRELNTCQYIILAVPLLLDSPPFKALVDRILVIDCSEETQIERVTSHRHISNELATNIIRQQTPRSVRLKLADDIIENTGEIGELDEKVLFLHNMYSLM